MFKIQLIVVFYFLTGDIFGSKVYIKLRHQESFALDEPEFQEEQEYVHLKPGGKLERELSEFIASQKSHSTTTSKPDDEHDSKSNLESKDEHITSSDIPDESNMTYPNDTKNESPWEASFAERAKRIKEYLSKKFFVINGYVYDKDNVSATDYKFTEKDLAYMREFNDTETGNDNITDFSGASFDETPTDSDYDEEPNKTISHLSGKEEGKPQYASFSERLKRIKEYISKKLKGVVYPTQKKKLATVHTGISLLRKAEDVQDELDLEGLVKKHPLSRQKRSKKYVNANEGWKLHYSTTWKPTTGKDDFEVGFRYEHKKYRNYRKCCFCSVDEHVGNIFLFGTTRIRNFRDRSSCGLKTENVCLNTSRVGRLYACPIEEKDMREAEKRKINIIIGSIFGTLGMVLLSTVLVYCFVKDPNTFCIAFATGCPCIVLLCPCIARWIEKWMDPSKVVQEKMNIYMPGVIIHEDGKIEHYKPTPEEMECVIDIVEIITG